METSFFFLFFVLIIFFSITRQFFQGIVKHRNGYGCPCFTTVLYETVRQHTAVAMTPLRSVRSRCMCFYVGAQTYKSCVLGIQFVKMKISREACVVDDDIMKLKLFKTFYDLNSGTSGKILSKFLATV